MKFSPEFIERVAEGNNLVDIISQHTQLKPAGSGLMGRCPFPDHPEKTPSFSVSETKQVYHCFGCHKKGNIYTFLQQYNGMSFREAVEFLAQRAQIALPQVNEQEASRFDAITQKKRQLGQVNKLAANYFHENLLRLPVDHPVRQYTEKRKITQEMIETFQVGYASDDWDGLVQHLQSKNISMALAEEARLVKARSGGKTGYFDLFRDRLIFPIVSTMAEPIAFGGRIIFQGEPKYLNSPETPVFHKGKVLYGLYQTAKFIRSEDSAVIVEGYMDLVSLYQAGIQNVVATMGTALTSDHGRLLGRITKNVVVLFDGDSAGQEAAERSLPILLAAGLFPKGLVLPDNQDPDDFVKTQGPEALKNLMAMAPDLMMMILQMWMKGYRAEPAEKVKLSNRLIPIFQAIQDPRLKQLYCAEISQKMGVEDRWLRQALQAPGPQQSVNAAGNDFQQKNFQTGIAGSFRGENASTNATDAADATNGPILNPQIAEEIHDQIQLKGASQAEVLLMGMVLKNHANFDLFLRGELLEEIPHPGVKQVLKRAAEVYRQVPEKFDKLTSLLASFVDRPEFLIESSPLMGSGSDDGDDSKVILDCMRKVKEQIILQKRKQLTQEMKNHVGSEKHHQLMLELAELKKQELSLRANGFIIVSPEMASETEDGAKSV